jgi:RNA polymerase sigma factor (sigma-70 family)
VEGRPLDDRQLVEHAQQGDVAAYEELVSRYQGVAYRVAAFAAGTADADDVVQDAFVKAYRSLARFRPDAPFRPWLLRIVTNESSNRRRSSGRRAGLVERAANVRPSGNAAPSPEEAALGSERRAELRAALDALPDNFRLVVTCRYLVDLSEAETAEVLGWPRGTVKSRLARALDRLRAALGEVDDAKPF